MQTPENEKGIDVASADPLNRKVSDSQSTFKARDTQADGFVLNDVQADAARGIIRDYMLWGTPEGEIFDLDLEESGDNRTVIEMTLGGRLYLCGIFGWAPMLRRSVAEAYKHAKAQADLALCVYVASDLAEDVNSSRLQSRAARKETGAAMLDELFEQDEYFAREEDALKDPRNWRGVIPKDAAVVLAPLKMTGGW